MATTTRTLKTADHSRVSAEDRIATMFPQSVVGELEACFGVDGEHTILHR